MPDMIYVESSNIEAIGYEEGSQQLYVRFHSGAMYMYSNVSKEVFDRLMIAPSKGSFFNREIRGIYEYSHQ